MKGIVYTKSKFFIFFLTLMSLQNFDFLSSAENTQNRNIFKHVDHWMSLYWQKLLLNNKVQLVKFS